MKTKAVCEYNDPGFSIYVANCPGTYVRAATENEVLAKFGGELRSCLRGRSMAKPSLGQIVQPKESARTHTKAMSHTAKALWGGSIPNPFCYIE